VPQKVPFAVNRRDSLIKMPFVTEVRYTATDYIGVISSELFSPFAHRLVSDKETAISKHIFDHAEAQRKPEIQPDRLCNNLGWKAMAVIKRGAIVEDALLYLYRR